jgi:hypothetical protein
MWKLSCFYFFLFFVKDALHFLFVEALVWPGYLLIVEMDAYLIIEKEHTLWWGWENISLA